MPADHDLLVTTDWLEDHLNDPDVWVIDVRGYVVTRPIEPGVEAADYRGAIDEYLASHIPGAVYVDWTTDIIDPDELVAYAVLPESSEAFQTGWMNEEAQQLARDGAAEPDPAKRDEITTTVREVGRAVRDDDRLLPALLPTGDGLLVAVRR